MKQLVNYHMKLSYCSANELNVVRYILYIWVSVRTDILNQKFL